MPCVGSLEWTPSGLCAWVSTCTSPYSVDGPQSACGGRSKCPYRSRISPIEVSFSNHMTALARASATQGPSSLPLISLANSEMCRWKYFIGCYGCSFIPALAYLFVNTKNRGKVYGPALVSIQYSSEKQVLTLNQLWCWVSPQWDPLRVATLYGVVWYA